MFVYIFGIILDILWITFYFIGIFYLGVGLLSLMPSKYKKISNEYLKFAIVIPAHNEGNVIKNLLLSLKSQEYPDKCYDIYVMADKCLDNTALVSLEMGAKVLYRTSNEISGKGIALADAFMQIREIDNTFDGYVIIDADNIADRRFLKEINIAMLQGHNAVQGYIDSKNPMKSWVSHAHSVWYWITNHTIQKGFSDLGIGCSLGGTGFALSKGLLDEVNWDVNSLAEDAEYTIKLCIEGEKVYFAPSAVVFDEKPCKFSESVKQRVRWAKGIFSVEKTYFGILLKKGKIFDLLMLSSNWLMPLIFIVYAALTTFVMMKLMGIINIDLLQLWISPFNILSLCAFTFGMIFLSFAALVQDKKYDSKIILNTVGFLIYIFSWIPIGTYGVLKHRTNKWYHTKHNE